MKTHLGLCIWLLVGSLYPAGADTRPLDEWVGLDLAAAFQALGAPMEVYTMRGDEAWQDDVVFYFKDHSYLFWYQNRVWQVRLDKRHEAEFYSLKMGMTKEEALTRMGKPLEEVDGTLLFDLQGKSFPIRLRLIFEGGALSDIYCYRSDF